jgi:hypothetical protein
VTLRARWMTLRARWLTLSRSLGDAFYRWEPLCSRAGGKCVVVPAGALPVPFPDTLYRVAKLSPPAPVKTGSTTASHQP